MTAFRQNRFLLWPIYLLIAVFPLAVAGQNIGVVISFMGLVSFMLTEVDRKVDKMRGQSNGYETPRGLKWLFRLTFSYVIWMCVATHLAPDNQGSNVAAYFVGFMPFLVLPPMFRYVYEDLSRKTIENIWKTLNIAVFTLALIAVSQHLFGWHKHIDYFSAHSHRAQGLYSHPLTFAYALIAIWPMATIRLIDKPNSKSSWVFFLSVMACIWTSQSRTAQLTAVLILFLNFFLMMKPLTKWVAVSALLTGIVITAVTENPVSKLFKGSLHSASVESTEIQYPFDRAIFWHAHATLVSKRPITGYGVHIPSQIKTNAYNEIGMEDFPKKYTAHNMYLQVLTEGGAIGLLIFCLWYFGYIYHALFRNGRTQISQMVGQGLLGVGIAGMTQNAFQDSEVRHVLMLLIIIFWCTYSLKPSEQEESQA